MKARNKLQFSLIKYEKEALKGGRKGDRRSQQLTNGALTRTCLIPRAVCTKQVKFGKRVFLKRPDSSIFCGLYAFNFK